MIDAAKRLVSANISRFIRLQLSRDLWRINPSQRSSYQYQLVQFPIKPRIQQSVQDLVNKKGANYCV